MSIADELTALNTNLKAAKDAVVAKGGTLQSNGFNTLAAEIAAIPSGGGPSPEPAFSGFNVWYATDADHDTEGEWVKIPLTQEDIALFCPQYLPTGITEIALANGTVSTSRLNGDSGPTANILRAVSIDGSVANVPDRFLWGCGTIKKVVVEEGVTSLGSNFWSTHNGDGDISLPKSLETIGGGFLRQCYNFNHPVIMPKVKTLGSSCLNEAKSFNSTIEFPELESIGVNFLYGSSSNPMAFNQDITFPATLTTFKWAPDMSGATPSFMGYCNNFTSTITVECPPFLKEEISSGTANAMDGLFGSGGSSVPIYSQGFYYTGTYANDWFSTFGFLNYNPIRYRNPRVK